VVRLLCDGVEVVRRSEMGRLRCDGIEVARRGCDGIEVGVDAMALRW